MGKRHLGTLSVSGFKRVPWPAARRKAFICAIVSSIGRIAR